MMEPSPYRWTMTAEDSAPRTMIMANTPSLSALQSRTQIFSQFSGYEGRRCSCCSLVCGCCMENDNQNAGPDALPAGQYETGTIDFNPAAQRPYSGCTLELRKGRSTSRSWSRTCVPTLSLTAGWLPPPPPCRSISSADEHVAGHPNPSSAGFSFLLATPVELAAGVLKIPDVTGRLARASAARYWLARSLCSGIGAFLAVRFLLRYL